jgi:hypothetical protein
MNDTLLVFGKKILKIPKQKGNQNPEIEEQTAQIAVMEILYFIFKKHSRMQLTLQSKTPFP